VKISVLKEIHVDEKRVATTPDVTQKLIKLGFDVIVETGAGVGSNFSDESYRQAGAEIALTAELAWKSADLVIKVRPPEQNFALGCHEVDLMSEGCHLISFLWPAQNEKLLKQKGVQKWW
jgi:NAD(P) transhydrogenase subunit alpha